MNADERGLIKTKNVWWIEGDEELSRQINADERGLVKTKNVWWKKEMRSWATDERG